LGYTLKQIVKNVLQVGGFCFLAAFAFLELAAGSFVADEGLFALDTEHGVALLRIWGLRR
jgi:hypothetical protein